MQRQPSPPHLSPTTAAATPILSPTGDHDPEIQSPIPTTPQNPVPDDCSNEEPVAHDASQRAQLEDDVQMGEPEHQPMPHSPPIIHIDDSDDDTALAMAEAPEKPIDEPVTKEQAKEPVAEDQVEEPVVEEQVEEPAVKEQVEEPMKMAKESREKDQEAAESVAEEPTKATP